MSVTTSTRLRAAWDRFFHAERTTAALGLFRILFAYCLYDEVTTTRSKSVYAIANDAMHLPYFDWLPHLSQPTYHLLHDLQYPLIVLFGLGLLTRVAGWPLLALQTYIFFTDQLNFRNHPYFFLLVLLLMLLGPCDEALSIRSLWRSWRARIAPATALLGRPRPIAMQRLIQLLVCIAYFYAGVHKSTWEYLSGRILALKLEDEILSRTSGEILSRLGDEETIEAIALSPASMAFGSWVTVLVELALPFMLWSRRLRPAAILIGTGFHLTIRFSMEITTFSYAMIATYLLFVEPETVRRVLARLPGLRRADAAPAAASADEARG